MFSFKGFKSGISANYSTSSQPNFYCGPWAVHSGRKRGSHDEKSQVSVFVFDKKKLEASLAKSSLGKAAAEDVFATIRRQVSALTKMRHPALLEIIEPLQESRSSMTFVAESVVSTGKILIDSHYGSAKFHSDPIEADSSDNGKSSSELDDLTIQKGFLQLVQALKFLHNSAGVVHLNLVPSSVLITVKGDWKLSGLQFMESFKDRPATFEYIAEPFDPRLPYYANLDYDFCAPELLLSHQLTPKNDIFALGCLLLAFYTGSSPLSTGHDIQAYRSQLSRVLRLPHLSEKLPDHTRQVLPSLLASDPGNRWSIQQFEDSPYFDSPLIRALKFLDAFATKPRAEQIAFVRGFPAILAQFPPQIRTRKLLPTLIDLLEMSLSGAGDLAALGGDQAALAGALFLSVLLIGQSLSQLTFQEQVLPVVKKTAEIPLAQSILFDKLEVLIDRLNARDFKESVLPLFRRVVDPANAAPLVVVQEKALLSVPRLATKLDFATLKNEVFPPISVCFQKTTSLAVKIAALKAFQTLVVSGGIDKFTVKEKLLPVLTAMKTRESSVLLACLPVYEAVSIPSAENKSAVDVAQVAESIIPQMWAQLAGGTLDRAGIAAFMASIRAVEARVEAEVVAQADARGPSEAPATVAQQFGDLSLSAPVSRDVSRSGTPVAVSGAAPLPQKKVPSLTLKPTAKPSPFDSGQLKPTRRAAGGTKKPLDDDDGFDDFQSSVGALPAPLMAVPATSAFSAPLAPSAAPVAQQTPQIDWSAAMKPVATSSVPQAPAANAATNLPPGFSLEPLRPQSSVRQPQTTGQSGSSSFNYPTGGSLL